MREMQSYTYGEAHAGYGDSRQSDLNAVLNWNDASVSELFQTSQNQMFSNTGIRTRRFAGANDSFRANVHAAHLTGMNASSVIPTGGWSSPSEDFFSIVFNDGHAVFGFDFIDAIPADRVFLDGVRNGYALIEDCNFGAINNQINDSAEEDGPDKGYEAAFSTTRKPSLDIQSEYQKQNYAGAKSAGFGSEYLGISHDAMVTYESGDFGG